MGRLTLTLLLAFGVPVASFALPVLNTGQGSLLDYQPERHVLHMNKWKFLEVADWSDKASLDSIETSDLGVLVCSEVEGIKDLACGQGSSPIGERKSVALGKAAGLSIALWLNTSAVIFSGTLIVREADQYVLYWFRRDMSLEDLNHDGRYAVVSHDALIYKAWEFFGLDRDPSVWWNDIFVFDGVLRKVDERYPNYYRALLTTYRDDQETIRLFDVAKYAAENKMKFADPVGWEDRLKSEKTNDLQILDVAIKAVEMILKKGE